MLAAAGGRATISPRPAAFTHCSSRGRIERLDQRIFEEWNSFSRDRRVRAPATPTRTCGGRRPVYDPADWPTRQRGINIDGAAGTTTYGVDGDVERAGFLRYDVTNLAYFLPRLEKAAVIGVGGGRDLLSARLFGVSEVTGVEINPILQRLLDPRARLRRVLRRSPTWTASSIEVDEARSWLARSDETFDIIQMSLVDTWAATGAGAYSLSENGLYTVEAWRTFLDRLEPGRACSPSAAGTRRADPRRPAGWSASPWPRCSRCGAADPRRHIFLAGSGPDRQR